MMLRQPLENYPITTDPQYFKNIEGLKYKLEAHTPLQAWGSFESLFLLVNDVF